MPTHFFSLMNFCISLLGCPLPPSTKSSQTNFLSVAKRWLANTIPLLAWTLHSFRMLFVYQKDPAMLCACVVTFSFFEWFQRVVSADPSALSEAVQGITQVWPLTQFHSGCLFCVNELPPFCSRSFLPAIPFRFSIGPSRLESFLANPEPINGPQPTYFTRILVCEKLTDGIQSSYWPDLGTLRTWSSWQPKQTSQA